MIVLRAKCAGKPGSRSDVLRLIAQVTPPSRVEAGCIAYDVYESTAAENEFLFFEEWDDQAALDFHFGTPHFQAFFAGISGLLAGPPSIRVYDVAATRDLQL